MAAQTKLQRTFPAIPALASWGQGLGDCGEPTEAKEVPEITSPLAFHLGFFSGLHERRNLCDLWSQTQENFLVGQ